MSQAQGTLAVIGALAALLILGSSVYVIFTATTKDARMKRLSEENTDLVRRLDWIEPRFRETEAKNSLLMEIHNPTARLESMERSEKANHEKTVRLLTEQRVLLTSIEAKMDRSKP